MVTLTTLHKVLQNLLAEKVAIRDMRTILETLAEHAPMQNDPHELTSVVRVALGRAITQQWFPGNDEVQVIGLDTPLERLLLQALQGGGGLEPGLADRLLRTDSGSAGTPRDAGCAAGAVGQPCVASVAGPLLTSQSAATGGVVEYGNVG